MPCPIKIREKIEESIDNLLPYREEIMSKEKAKKISTNLNTLWNDAISRINQYSSQGGYKVIINDLTRAVEKEFIKQQEAEQEFERTLDFFNGDEALMDQENKYDNGVFLQKNNNEIDFSLKSIEILSSEKAKQVFDKGNKNGWSLEEILDELGKAENDTSGLNVEVRRKLNAVDKQLQQIVDFNETKRLKKEYEEKGLGKSPTVFKDNNKANELKKQKEQLEQELKDNEERVVEEVYNIPKEQKQLILDRGHKVLTHNDARVEIINGKKVNNDLREQIITDLLANYSFVVEINTAYDQKDVKEGGGEFSQINAFTNNGFRYIASGLMYAKYPENNENNVQEITKKEFNEQKDLFINQQKGTPTAYYSHLKTPGGINYTENAIQTPDIINRSIAHIKDFAKGISNMLGWFRSDDRDDSGETNISSEGIVEQFSYNNSIYKIVTEVEPGLGSYDNYYKDNKEITKKEYDEAFKNKPKKNNTKTRRILEVQSDLFQKWRNNFEFESNKYTAKKDDKNVWHYYKNGNEINANEYTKIWDKFLETYLDNADTFTKLLQKDNNWITFFIKSIIQDSAKKGYEKVLFPTGETASKIQKHETLEEFKKQKEDRIEELERRRNNKLDELETAKLLDSDRRILERETVNLDSEIITLKQELERVETEGFGALRPIYNFYENTVTNILKKQGYVPVEITDEYGNTWNEIEITSEIKKQQILLQKSSTIPSKASPETIKLIKDLLKQIGVDYKSVENIVVNGKKQDANGVALTMQKIIEVVNGKESSALPEEAMHFVVEIIKQTNPTLYKQLLKEINAYKIKDKVIGEYGADANYQKDGKPDIIKLKEEAIAKLLVEVIIKKQEGITDKPELIAKVETSWWESIKNWIRSLFIKNGFDKLALDIISGKNIGTADDIKQGSVFLQKENKGIQQDELINNLKETASIVIEGDTSEDGYTVNGVKTKRVSDLSKTWYDARFADKSLLKSDYQQAVDNLVQEKGTAGHADIEHIHTLFVNEDGYLREQVLDDSNYVSKINEENRDAYNLLKKNYKERLTSFPKGTRFLSEQIVYNSKTNRAGKIDFLAITPEGKVSILDWKFINLNIDNYKDIPWFKIQAWNIQMREYKAILMNAYGVKNEDFEQTRMIPIKTFYTETNAKTGVLPKLIKIQIGDVNVKNIQEDYLIPVPLKEERTHKEEIDVLLAKLNSTYEKIAKSPVSENQKKAKAEELNTLFTTIRQLQMKESLEPLLNQVRVLGKRVKTTIKKYEEEFKGKSPEDFTSQEANELINKFTGEIAILREALQTYEDIDVDFSYLFTKNTEEDKKLEKDLKDVVHDTKVFARQLGKLDMEFTETFIGGTSQAEKIVKGISKWFGSTSTIQIKSLQALYKKANRVFGYAGMDVQQQNKILTDLKNKYQAWANSKGLSNKNMFDILMKKDKNELIDEFNPEFFKEANKRTKDKDGAWIAKNIDIKSYAAHLKEVKAREVKHAKEKYERSLKTEKDLRILENELNSIPRLYDISDVSKPGFLLYNEIKKFPKRELWESAEWKTLNATGNEPALAFYNYIKERNKEYTEIGYISHQKARVFLPWVRKSLADKMMFGGNVTLGEQFIRSISVDGNQTGYGSYDPITGKLIDTIPKYLINPSEGIENNYSKDLFKTMSMYNEFAIKFKYLSSIEDQARALVRLEQNKQAIATSAYGTIEKDEFGNIKLESNAENASLVESMVKAIVYQQKYVESQKFDTLLKKFGKGFDIINKKLGYNVFPTDLAERQISVNKTIDTLNTTFQMTTLGLNLLSATSNFFGGKALSIINSGKYFTKKDHLATEMWLLANKMGGEDKIKNLAALDYFLPFTENYNRDDAKKLSLATIDSQGVQDFLMILMRQTDRAVQTTNFFAFARNAIVENGKIVNVREYLRTLPKYQNMYKGATQEERNKLKAEFEEEVSTIAKERNIIKIGKLENNEFVIPGIEQRSESVIELRRLVQSFTADALGNMTEENKRLINMSIYGNSFMVFKNWIPRLADVRFGNLKYNAASEAYEWGRMRLMVNIISDDITTKSMNLYNSLAGNDKGIEYLRELYERKKDSYKEETNKELEMTEDEFIDLVRNNIKNQAMELATLLSLWSLILLLGAMAPNDDDPEEIRNTWKFVLKATDKLKDELQYFYNPASPFDLMSQGIFPSMSLIKNYVTLTRNFVKETYAIGIGDEELQDKNNVIKYFMKSFPITNQFAAYLPMFYPELAKELGIRMQSQYGIR